MKTAFRVACAVSCLFILVLTVPVRAQGPDLAGTWEVQASGVLEEVDAPALRAGVERGVLQEPCVFEGTGDVVQDGSQVTGQVTLTLVSGPPGCPDEMMADLTGSLDGFQFGGVLDGGQLFGALDFVGTVAGDGGSIQGSYTVRPGGPFSNVINGTWSAVVQHSILAIPTLGTWGLLALAALLLLASVRLLRHRPA